MRKKTKTIILINNGLGLVLVNYLIKNTQDNISVISRSPELLAQIQPNERIKKIPHKDLDFETEKSYFYNYWSLILLIWRFWFVEIKLKKVNVLLSHRNTKSRAILSSYPRIQKLVFYEDGSGSYIDGHMDGEHRFKKKVKFPLLFFKKPVDEFYQFTKFSFPQIPLNKKINIEDSFLIEPQKRILKLDTTQKVLIVTPTRLDLLFIKTNKDVLEYIKFLTIEQLSKYDKVYIKLHPRESKSVKSEVERITSLNPKRVFLTDELIEPVLYTNKSTMRIEMLSDCSSIMIYSTAFQIKTFSSLNYLKENFDQNVNWEIVNESLVDCVKKSKFLHTI